MVVALPGERRSLCEPSACARRTRCCLDGTWRPSPRKGLAEASLQPPAGLRHADERQPIEKPFQLLRFLVAKNVPGGDDGPGPRLQPELPTNVGGDDLRGGRNVHLDCPFRRLQRLELA